MLEIYLDESSLKDQRGRLAEIMVAYGLDEERAQEEAQIIYKSMEDLVEEGIKKYKKSYSKEVVEDLTNMGLAILIEKAKQMIYDKQF